MIKAVREVVFVSKEVDTSVMVKLAPKPPLVWAARPRQNEAVTKRLKEQHVAICLLIAQLPPLRIISLHCVFNDFVFHVPKMCP